MADIIKHDYLRSSIEQRVERKMLYNEYLDSFKFNKQIQSKRPTKASQLRSLSNLEKSSAASSIELIENRVGASELCKSSVYYE